MNKPYVRSYDSNGELVDQFESVAVSDEKRIKIYKSEFPNRSQRRDVKQKNPFNGNDKRFGLVVAGKFKYRKRLQKIVLKDGSVKTIKHFDLKSKNY